MSVPLPSFAYRLREVRVVFGSGALQHLPAEMRRLGVDHPLILSTPGRADAVAQAQAVLGDRSTGTFTRAQVHVPADIVAEAVEAAVAHHANALVAIGGGSAVGLGKAMAARTGLPLMAVPTTYSGSEMTDIWGVTDGRRKETGRDARSIRNRGECPVHSRFQPA